jgi:hypothetical protein
VIRAVWPHFRILHELSQPARTPIRKFAKSVDVP